MSKTRITGYQIAYSARKSFSSGTKMIKVKGYSKTSKKIGKLKSGKTYYVKIRTYKVVKGKTLYSPWSKAKKTKTK